MNRLQVLKAALAGSASMMTLLQPAAARSFNIPDGDLSVALVTYVKQSDSTLIYLDSDVRGHRSRGAHGDYTDTAALTQVLKGTGFAAQTMPMNTIAIVPAPSTPKPAQVEIAQATPRKAPASDVETVVVTAQHKSENIQQVPIAITALSQQQLTERQIATGGDLIRDTPNMNFGKTNFTGYSIELRGIGTQAISVTTDPAVAVAFNDTPFIRNHFFEQEFFDVQDVEVLRGPQGTLFGRNATAGVVNIKSALPTDSYEAMLSADMGNYSNRRLEGMVNVPIVGDKLDIRVAGEWTKRDGYSFNEETNSPIDGRDLWSGRVSIGFTPSEHVRMNLVWEHYSEDDDRLRSGKQLCHTDYGPGFVATPNDPSGRIGTVNIGGVLKDVAAGFNGGPNGGGDYFTQGCAPASLYSPQSFQAPLGFALPYILALQDESQANSINPYASETQSQNLRVIDSGINPVYRAKNDVVELNAEYAMTPELTVSSLTGYGNDSLFSTEDYNRFGAAPGLFAYSPLNNGQQAGNGVLPDPNIPGAGIFCDPQLGCSDRLMLEDLSQEHSWQVSQEFRIASNFSGPFNFSAGANYLHYETLENYYVFGNVLTLINGGYNPSLGFNSNANNPLGNGFQYPNPHDPFLLNQGYVDPNPIGSLNGEGHNYFRSENPYLLNSYALFGETNYKLSDELKFTAGLRLTDDQKHFTDIPSWLVEEGWGYPVAGVVDQKWTALTGRAVVNWTPNLDFTDQTLVYGSYSHGYKAGGANPPGAIYPSDAFVNGAEVHVEPTHPLTFKPEFIDAFELGTKNTLLDGTLTLNADVFFYNYTGYQISEIVDRTAVNSNYNATVKGAELESTWEPTPGLRFSFAGGFEDTRVDNGQSAVDLIDRTAGTPGWYVVKPFVNESSNCIFPAYVAENIKNGSPQGIGASVTSYCAYAYLLHDDPITGLPYVANPTATAFGNPVPPGYVGFNPATAPNNGAGFSKNLGGNSLPNAPPFTASFTAEYTIPVSQDWAATLHGDFYWQADSWARVFNDNPYDRLHGYSNVNLSLILTSANGWQVMGYVKNVFDTTAITGDFLNSDDSGLTTNVFLTDPRLYGIRVTKHLDEGDGFWGSDYSGAEFINGLFSDTDKGKPALWIELGGQLERLQGSQEIYSPPFLAQSRPSILAAMVDAQRPPAFGLAEEAKITFTPEGSDWIVLAAVRYGRSNSNRHLHDEAAASTSTQVFPTSNKFLGDGLTNYHNSHTILDFQAGKDLGLGMFGLDGSSIVSGGVRIAQFTSAASIQLQGRPYIHNSANAVFPSKYIERNRHTIVYTGIAHARRDTRAVGPSLSWDATTPIAENGDNATINFDWGINAAVLFGRQKVRLHQQTTSYHYNKVAYAYPHPTYGVHSTQNSDHNRRRSVTIPNLGGFAGLSFRFANAKVSFGYRADFFFNAMDTGFASEKSSNLGFFGPYAKISMGLGG